MKVAEDRPAKAAKKRTVRVPRNALLVRFFLHPAGKIFLGLVAGVLITSAVLFVHFYNQYDKLINERLRAGAYTATSRIYAAPGSVTVGDESSPTDLATVPSAPRARACSRRSPLRRLISSAFSSQARARS